MAAFGAALTVVVAGAVAVLVTRWLRLVTGADAFTPPEQALFLRGGSVQTHAWSRYHVRYYAMALLFLAFEVLDERPAVEEVPNELGRPHPRRAAGPSLRPGGHRRGADRRRRGVHPPRP